MTVSGQRWPLGPRVTSERLENPTHRMVWMPNVSSKDYRFFEKPTPVSCSIGGMAWGGAGRLSVLLGGQVPLPPHRDSPALLDNLVIACD